MPTTCVWLDGLAPSITEQYLTRHFCRYGHVVKVRYFTVFNLPKCIKAVFKMLLFLFILILHLVSTVLIPVIKVLTVA